MPKKLESTEALHIPAQDHIAAWGSIIRAQRIKSRIQLKDLAHRVGVSPPTMSRIEKGDPAVAVGSYLASIFILGLAEVLVPAPDEGLIKYRGQRVKFSSIEAGDDLGYF